MSEYRLEMCDVVKTFPGVKALNHAQLKLKPGTVHALMGENGAGKSTTMNIITGYLSATDGTVTINGHDIAEEPAAAKACIGYLPEQPPLHFSVPASSAGPAGTGSLEYIARQRLLCICPPSLRPPATS